MKIYFSPPPFVRKCLVAAHELGLADRIEKLPSAAGPVARDQTIIASNPLGQVPTFFTDDGQVLYDSRVICEYLNVLGGGALFPAEGKPRWQALTEQSLGDGMLGAALLARYETVLRPEALRWDGWYEGQMGKVRDGLALQEQNTAALAQRVDIGTITIGCALGYLDFRYPDYDWRAGFPPWPRGSPRSTSARPCRPRCRTPERDARFWGGQRGLGIPAGPRRTPAWYGAYRAAAGPLAQARALMRLAKTALDLGQQDLEVLLLHHISIHDGDLLVRVFQPVESMIELRSIATLQPACRIQPGHTAPPFVLNDCGEDPACFRAFYLEHSLRHRRCVR